MVLSSALILLWCRAQAIWLHEPPADGFVLRVGEPLYVNLRSHANATTFDGSGDGQHVSVCLFLAHAQVCSMLPRRLRRTTAVEGSAYIHDSLVLEGIPAGRHELQVRLRWAGTQDFRTE